MELPTPKRDNLIQQLLMALAFAIPWAKKAIPTLIGFVIVFALVRFLRRKSWSIPPQPLALLTLLVLFLLLVAGTTYSDHTTDAWNEIGIKLSFMIFPLLALITPTLQREDYRNIQNSFVAGCFLFIGITVGHAAVVVYQHPDWYYFTYDRLSWYIHPTYAATYQAMALFTLLHSGIKNNFLTGRKWAHVLAIIIMLGFIALLSSKAGYLCALLVIAYSMHIAYRQGIRIGRIVIQAALACLLFITTILVLPTSSDRVKDAVADIRLNDQTEAATDTTVAKHTSSTSMRLITWSASWNLLCENPFGTGTGDTQPQLNILYEQQGEHYAALRQFNAHNQFLQTGAEIGWPGLAALIIILVAVWIIGRSEPSAQLFVILCGLNFLFESFLEVQAGIVFFSFWILVFSRRDRMIGL
jgi:hypothetical protein